MDSSIQALEKAIEEVDYRASKKYMMEVSNRYLSGCIDEIEYQRIIYNYNDRRNRLFEEADEKYKGKLNFYCINEINDTNKFLVEYI